ncbi:hypothetical protein MHBO_004298 [Bonamia ostreae]|uniref:DIX domain-containing protein n=1 Tax=Bonamia ostreae TaxID=126728 RepID=A0ABV2ASX8_9EUKA
MTKKQILRVKRNIECENPLSVIVVKKRKREKESNNNLDNNGVVFRLLSSTKNSGNILPTVQKRKYFQPLKRPNSQKCSKSDSILVETNRKKLKGFHFEVFPKRKKKQAKNGIANKMGFFTIDSPEKRKNENFWCDIYVQDKNKEFDGYLEERKDTNGNSIFRKNRVINLEQIGDVVLMSL